MINQWDRETRRKRTLEDRSMYKKSSTKPKNGVKKIFPLRVVLCYRDYSPNIFFLFGSFPDIVPLYPDIFPKNVNLSRWSVDPPNNNVKQRPCRAALGFSAT